MNPVSRHTVVVIGAGPTGVTAATLLARHGIDTLVLDRWAGVYPQPRAVHLDDEVFRIAARMGIGAEFAAISRPAMGLRLLDPRLRVLAEFSRDPRTARHGYPQANMFDQPEFEALLRANLTRYPAAVLRAESEVTAIAERGDGVRITVTDRTAGTEYHVDADYLLGCDGANSMTREHIGSAMADLHFDQRWLVVDIASTADLDQWPGVHQLCDSRRAGTFMQIGDTRYRWEFRLLPGESAQDFRTVAALRPLIEPWTAGMADDRLEIIRVAEYTFRAKIAERWRRGPVFLLGDAAHLTPPFIGQGMCAGLRDAANLSWKLAGVIDGALDPGVLDSYEQERKPHVRSMIDLALTVGRAMTAGGRVGDALRRHLVPRMHLLPGMRAKVMDSTTPALRRSALVRKTLAPRQLAGTLCPNVAVDGDRRLDAVLGDWFGVISARPLTPEDRALAQRSGATTLVAEPGSELAAWLAHGRAAAAVVRPDGTVLYAGRDVHRVVRALPQPRHRAAVSARPPSGR